MSASCTRVLHVHECVMYQRAGRDSEHGAGCPTVVGVVGCAYGLVEVSCRGAERESDEDDGATVPWCIYGAHGLVDCRSCHVRAKTANADSHPSPESSCLSPAARRSGVSSVTLTHDSSHRSPTESSPSHSTSTECLGWQGYNCVLNLTSCEVLCLCKTVSKKGK